MLGPETDLEPAVSVVLSVLTASDLLHVSDLPAEGPRTLLVRHGSARGLITVVGEAPPLDWVQRQAAAERHEAGALAQHLGATADLELDASAGLGVLYTGWGRDKEGREHSFRYLTSNLEDEAGSFKVSGESITPDRVLKRSAQAPYSAQVVADQELPAGARRRFEGLPRLIKRGDLSAVALECASVVREAVPGPVLIVQLGQDGSLEAAILDGDKVTVLGAAEGPVARLTPA